MPAEVLTNISRLFEVSKSPARFRRALRLENERGEYCSSDAA
jgi:hypothetical protein